MNTLRVPLTWLLVCVLSLSGSACTSMKTIRPATDPRKPAFGSVKAGDKVTLHLHDGRRLQVTVAQVDDGGLTSAEGIRYGRSDIAQIQRRSFSIGRTTSLVAGVVLGAMVVAAALVAAALGSIMGTG
jgi:hypothetical protein